MGISQITNQVDTAPVRYQGLGILGIGRKENTRSGSSAIRLAACFTGIWGTLLVETGIHSHTADI